MKTERRIGFILGLVAFTATFFGCQKDNLGTSEERYRRSTPTSITVQTQTNAGISTAGGTVTLKVTILPSTANQNYTLSILSGSENVKLSGSVLTAVKNGTAIVKAVTQNGSLSDTCSVTITNQSSTTTTTTTPPPTTTPPTTTVPGDYYVSPSGSDSNPGTIDLPFKTVEKAYSVA